VIAAGSLEFALARMHARLARRLGPAAWSGIEQARAIAPILEFVRGSTLADVAKPFAAAHDLHALDRAARDAWAATIAEAAAWMPGGFASALVWCRVLALLPALVHLARHDDAPAWMASDSELSSLASAPHERRRTLLLATDFAPIAHAWHAPAQFIPAWRAEWRRRLPPRAFDDTALSDLAKLISRHFERLATAALHESAPLRADFEADLVKRFRRHTLEPVAVFAWLGLAALDIRRLRGELARRVAFPAVRSVP
jgi:hypothetical protein